jgi:hypothetical protein
MTAQRKTWPSSVDGTRWPPLANVSPTDHDGNG